MKYTKYPVVDDPSVPDGDREIHQHLRMIEVIQRDLWGDPMHDGCILKLDAIELMSSWLAGGIFQYDFEGHTISCTYALSRPEGDAYVDDDGVQWSGVGFEYFVETEAPQDWVLELLLDIVSSIYSEQGTVPVPGMIVGANSGRIPEDLNPTGLNLLFISRHQIEMPDGRCEYVQLVPMDEAQRGEYEALGADRWAKATEWFLSHGYDTCVRLQCDPSSQTFGNAPATAGDRDTERSRGQSFQPGRVKLWIGILMTCVGAALGALHWLDAPSKLLLVSACALVVAGLALWYLGASRDRNATTR